MRALQRAANANDGNRAANTTGYDASLDYVERRMNRAGYETERVPFDFAELDPERPRRPCSVGYHRLHRGQLEGGDYIVAQFSGSGNVTGPIVPIDYTGTAERTAGASTSGCEATDFPANPAPNSIALIQRGTCEFVDKIQNCRGCRLCRGADRQRRRSMADRESSRSRSRAEPFTPIPVAMTSSTVGLALLTAARARPRRSRSTRPQRRRCSTT